MVFNTKYGDIIVYAKTIEQEAISQIIEMANSPLGENAHIRIMPDCHAGAGCGRGWRGREQASGNEAAHPGTEKDQSHH